VIEAAFVFPRSVNILLSPIEAARRAAQGWRLDFSLSNPSTDRICVHADNVRDLPAIVERTGKWKSAQLSSP